MADIANTADVTIGDNAGKVGANNEVDVKGGVGDNSHLGNTYGIDVIGQNADTGRIGADNSYKIQGGLKDNAKIGNTVKVTAGQNSGAIGSGNKINFG